MESVLVPQVMTRGFLGLVPEPGGLAIAPKLPKDWPSLTVTGIAIQDRVIDVTAAKDGSIVLHPVSGSGSLAVRLAPGTWTILATNQPPQTVTLDASRPTIALDLASGDVRLSR
jgi:hypothetical protein